MNKLLWSLALSQIVILLCAFLVEGQEPKFYSPPPLDTLVEGDSVTVRLNAPRYPAHSGKYWSLGYARNPYMGNQSVAVLLDTLKLAADTAVPFTLSIKVPPPHPGESKYALALVYNPAVSYYLSGVFFVKRAPVPVGTRRPPRANRKTIVLHHFNVLGRPL